MFYVSTIKGWHKKVVEFPVLAMLGTPVFARLLGKRVEFHIFPDDLCMPTWVRLLSDATILYQRPDGNIGKYVLHEYITNVTVGMGLLYEEQAEEQLVEGSTLLAVVVNDCDGMRVVIFKRFDLGRFAECATKAVEAAGDAKMALDYEEYPDGIDPYAEVANELEGKVPSEIDTQLERDAADRKSMEF